VISILLKDQKVDKHKKLREDFKEFINKNNKKMMLDLQDKDGNTALHSFAEKGFKRFTIMLLEMGADVNVQNDHENTPLHLAVAAGQSFIVKEILNRNPQLDKRNRRGETAIDLIEQHRPGYSKWLPTKIHFNHKIALFNVATPMEETLSDDEEESELETITKKTTQEKQNQKNERESRKKVIEDSSDSESLEDVEEIKLERKALKKMETLFPNCTQEEHEKEYKKILEGLRNTSIRKKKLDSKERKIEKKKVDERKKAELEAENEKKRKAIEEIREEEERHRIARTMHHVVQDQVEEVTERLYERVNFSKFLEEEHEKRQATLHKHQHSSRMLTRLRELLSQIRQGTNDDEFSYKEVIHILQDLNGSLYSQHSKTTSDD